MQQSYKTATIAQLVKELTAPDGNRNSIPVFLTLCHRTLPSAR
jgi:hypothetical protein